MRFPRRVREAPSLTASWWRGQARHRAPDTYYQPRSQGRVQFWWWEGKETGSADHMTIVRQNKLEKACEWNGSVSAWWWWCVCVGGGGGGGGGKPGFVTHSQSSAPSCTFVCEFSAWLTLFHSQVKKGTFSQPVKEICIRDVVRIIFNLSKLWKAKFFILCDAILLVRLQVKLEIDHSWVWIRTRTQVRVITSPNLNLLPTALHRWS